MMFKIVACEDKDRTDVETSQERRARTMAKLMHVDLALSCYKLI